MEHAAERPPLEHVQRLASEAAAVLRGSTAGPLPIVSLKGLRGWAEELARQAAKDGRDDMFLGATELRLVPPFGFEEDD